eukprot:15404924-Alexandrium_andersonii.AAC.1
MPGERATAGSAPGSGAAPPGGTAPAAPLLRKVKLSSVVDVTAEADIALLEPARISRMFERFKATRG